MHKGCALSIDSTSKDSAHANSDNGVRGAKRQRSFFETPYFYGSTHLKPWLDWVSSRSMTDAWRIASDFLSQIPPYSILLDFGCGNGWATLIALAQKPRIFAVGVDIACIPLRKAASDASAQGVGYRSNFVACDCHRMPFRNEVFDAVLDINALHHLSSLHEGVAAIHDVLKAGGYSLVMEVVTNNFFILIGRRLNPRLGLMLSSGGELDFSSYSLMNSLRSAGFAILQKCYEGYLLSFLMMLARRYPRIANILPRPLLYILIYLEMALKRLPLICELGAERVVMCQKLSHPLHNPSQKRQPNAREAITPHRHHARACEEGI